MSHFVYILRCSDSTLYAGYTTDLEKRLTEHNGEGNTKTSQSAGAKYTRGRRPVQIIYHEKFDTRSEAMQREYAIKQLSRVQKEELVTS